MKNTEVDKNHIRILKSYGAAVKDGTITLYRGADVSVDIIKKLRYGDYLSASKNTHDVTGNAGATSYGKNCVKFTLPVEDVIVTGAGEYQYKGQSESISDSKDNCYPNEIYRAYNDAYGSNYTSAEIDVQDNVRSVASQALAGGRDEFDKLIEKYQNNINRNNQRQNG